MPKGIAEPSIVAAGGLKAAEQYQLVAAQPVGINLGVELADLRAQLLARLLL